MMRKHSVRAAILLCAAVAVASPAWAQAPYPGYGYPGYGQPQPPPAAYPGLNSWRAVAPTPDDAYRQGLINRWQLEQLQGPLPQALQGPSPNGDKAEPN
jgi:hypothetical protein